MFEKNAFFHDVLVKTGLSDEIDSSLAVIIYFKVPLLHFTNSATLTIKDELFKDRQVALLC